MNGAISAVIPKCTLLVAFITKPFHTLSSSVLHSFSPLPVFASLMSVLSLIECFSETCLVHLLI